MTPKGVFSNGDLWYGESELDDGEMWYLAYKPESDPEQGADYETKEPPRCCCFEYAGDNPDCPVHGEKVEG